MSREQKRRDNIAAFQAYLREEKEKGRCEGFPDAVNTQIERPGANRAFQGSEDPNRVREISPTIIHAAPGGAADPWANPFTVEHPERRPGEAGFLRHFVAQEAQRIIFTRAAELRRASPRLTAADLFVLQTVVDLTLTRSKWEDRTYVEEIARLANLGKSTIHKSLNKLSSLDLVTWEGRQGRDSLGRGYMSTVGIRPWAREAAKTAYTERVQRETKPLQSRSDQTSTTV
jgi:hypothetical protein